MTATKGFIRAAATTALDTRKADASKLVCNVDGTPRLGVIGPNPSIVVSDASTAPMRVAVAGPFAFATQRAGGDGVAIWTNDGAIFLTVTKPGSQSWITTVYVKHDDTDAGDADSLPVIGTVTGSAAAIPVEAAIPAGALKLATVLIPSTATSTQSSGVVITNVYPMTAFVGGPIPFRTFADLAAWGTAPPYQIASVIADPSASLNGIAVLHPGDGWNSLGGSGGGWTPLPAPQAGWTVNAPSRMVKVGREIHFHWSFTKATQIFAGDLILVLPANFRPSDTVVFACPVVNGGSEALTMLSVSPDGGVRPLVNPSSTARTLKLDAFYMIY